jgi:hypothetical protein
MGSLIADPKERRFETYMAISFPKDLLLQAQNVLAGWNQVSPVPSFGPLTTPTFSAEITSLTALDAEIAGLEAVLSAKYNQREAVAGSLWDKVKRVRNAIKGVYGDDSTQYEMVGGTRMSERKPRTRKRPATE